MIVLENNEYVVKATDTQELVSRHPFKEGSKYEKDKAYQGALASNTAWKSQQ